MSPEAEVAPETEAAPEKKKTPKAKVAKERADTSDAVQKVAGEEIKQQEPLDLRPKVEHPPITHHLKKIPGDLPTAGEAVKAAATAGVVAMPIIGVPVAFATVTGKKIWNRLRGKPEESPTYMGTMKEGLRSTGRVVSAPFKWAYRGLATGAEIAYRGAMATLGEIHKDFQVAMNKLTDLPKGTNILSGAGTNAWRALGNAVELPFKVGGKLVDASLEILTSLATKPLRTSIAAAVAIGALANPAAAMGLVDSIGKAMLAVINWIPSMMKVAPAAAAVIEHI